MRHSFSSNYDVAHLWAHQLQDSARCNNLYFQGNTIYSYGTHFPISCIVCNSHGEKAYIYNSNTFSHATATHQRYVSHAIPHNATVFCTCGCLTPEFKDGKNIGYLDAITVVAQKISNIIELMNKQRKARTNNYRPTIIDSCKFIYRWIAFWDLDKRQNWRDSSYDSTASKRPSIFE